MKKFVSSVIFSLILSFLSVAVIVLFLSPLVSLVYYGFFAGENPITFYSHIINKVVNTEVVTIVLMAVQLFLTFGFIFSLFAFVKKIINVFLKDEKLVKPYYIIFFFMILILPVILITASILFKVKL